MRAALALVWRDAFLRHLAGITLIFGGWIATIGPFQSLVAVELFGLSDQEYAGLLLAALLLSVAASVGIGIVTDQRPSRRLMALMAAGALAAGGAVVALTGSVAGFVLAHVVFLPVAGTILGQIVAVARLHGADRTTAERDAILAVLRACMAAPWIILPAFWGAVQAAGTSLLVLYPVLATFGMVKLALIARSWPADSAAPWTERKSGLGFRASLAEMMAGPVALRVMLFGAIHMGGALTGTLVGLTFAEAGRPIADVGLFFSVFVLFETLGTFAIGTLVLRFRRLHIVAAGTVLYALYLALLPFLAGSWTVWLLTPLAGFGGAFIYTLAISYLQDLLGARAGAGASLMALQRLSSDGLSAVIFALGAWVAGYWLVALLGAFGTILAIAAILVLDARRR